MVKVWLTVTVDGVAVMLLAVTAAAATTGTAAEIGPATWETPLFSSAQVAVALRLRVCALSGAVHPDQVKVVVAPRWLTGVAGGVVQLIPVSDSAVRLTVAPPVLARVRLTVKPWPVLSVDGEVVSAVAVTAAAVCTVALAVAAPEVTAREASLASVPEAEADSTHVPADAETHPA